ncbi:MAG: hypothetical protein WD627_05875 [Actinomycetota bacterium]
MFLSLSIVFALPGSALAQTLTTVTANSSGSFSVSVTIPSGTAAGVYDIAATGTAPVATPYPVSSSPTISVSRSAVFAGETVQVTGSGWSPNTTVTLRLELVNLTEATFSLAQTTQTVTARARIQVIAVGATLSPGDITRNIFIFNGLTDPGGRSGPIIVNNNNSSSSSSSAAASAGGGASTPAAAAGTVGSASPATTVTRGLARTGIEALPLLAAGIATILLGTVMVRAGRRRNEALNSISG